MRNRTIGTNFHWGPIFCILYARSKVRRVARGGIRDYSIGRADVEKMLHPNGGCFSTGMHDERVFECAGSVRRSIGLGG
jgi:hypothetical protein